MILRFELNTADVNDLQVDSIRRALQMAKHAHWTDLEFRINGTYKHIQADWLKHLKEVP